MSGPLMRLGAYVLVVVAGVAGFWAIQNEEEERNREVCQSNNEIRLILIELLEQSRGAILPPGIAIEDLPPGVSLDDLDPTLRLLIERSQARSEAFREQANAILAPRDCDDEPFTDDAEGVREVQP